MGTPAPPSLAGPEIAEAPAHGVRVRFAATLAANLLRALSSFAAGVVVARALGASGYGNLNFLLASFAAFLPLLDAGSSSAFFTFLARERRTSRFFALYSAWLLLQAVIPILLIALILPDSVARAVWLDQPRAAVLLAFGSVFLTTQVWGSISRMGEARRLTLYVQAASVIQAVTHLVVVSVAAAVGWLTVPRTLALLILEFAILSLVVAPRMLRLNIVPSAHHETTAGVVSQFWKYCRPLVIYSWIGVPYAFADRWMLQAFGGPAQQGYFAFGSQFAAVSLLATSSILSVFWKEIADAIGRGDRPRVRMLHWRVTRSLYVVSAWLSCALIPHSREILHWTAGPAYEAGALALALLLLIPVHQSLGQIQGAFLFASEDTRAYAMIGIATMIASIPLAYAMLAPRAGSIPGLGLGAVGLALKMIVLQLVSVNVQGWFIARRNGWSLDLSHQLLSFLALLGVSWSLRVGAEGLSRAAFGQAPASVIVPLSIVTFAALSVAAALKWPEVAGMPQGELQRMMSFRRARQ